MIAWMICKYDQRRDVGVLLTCSFSLHYGDSVVLILLAALLVLANG